MEETDLEELLEQMKFALEMADRNARLIHPTPWQEAQVHPYPPQHCQHITQLVSSVPLDSLVWDG